jgi:plasmid maintenance system antidote protein VapI
MEGNQSENRHDSRFCRTFPEREPQEVTIAEDRHYTVKELAEAWHVSPNTVRRFFAEEPGVMKFTATSLSRNPRKRHMVQLRIPRRVALRVHARLSN